MGAEVVVGILIGVGASKAYNKAKAAIKKRLNEEVESILKDKEN